MRPSTQATPTSGTGAFWSLPQDGLLAATASVAEAIRRLEGLDVSVRLVTGDNRLAARKVAATVGLQAGHLLTGGDIDRLDDPATCSAWPWPPGSCRSYRVDRHRAGRHARAAHQPALLPEPAGPLGLTAVPAEVLAILVGLTALYVIANEAAKRRYPPADTAVTRGERA